MATANSFDGEPKTLDSPVFFKSFFAIFGTGWEKPAVMS
jgi:hypothetical protein